ncbi:uncharacterized protein VTP21DRAFT_9641 [Calcarisporiella thermophila]|uniref:uncharacterized protein n=1 Tax=Calcarisporiella thermophila TaxID=911321 RepID=UPI003743DA81
MKQLSGGVITRIASLSKDGLSTRRISRTFGISCSSVNKYQRLYAPQAPKPTVGRPRILSRQEKVLVRNFKAGLYENIPDAKEKLKKDYDVDISLTGIRDALKRRTFACKRRSWTLEDWKRVIWSDESKFKVASTGRKRYYWKAPGDPSRDHHYKKVAKYAQ